METEHADPATYSVGGAGLAWRETGGEIVVLDVDGSVYFGLNASGAELWKRLADGPTTRAELTAMLTASGLVEHGRASTDVDEFLAKLSSFGLLQQG